MGSDGSIVEDGGLGRHVPVDDTELTRVGRPGDIVDGPLFIKRDASVKRTVRAQEIERRLAVVALAGAVNIGLRQHEDAGAALVPLELDLVALEKCLLRNGGVELWDIENANGGGLALALRDKDCDSVVLASGSESEISDSLDAKLVPDSDEIVSLIELHLVGDEACAVLFVGRVLEVPTSLLLLDEAANGLLISGSNTIFDCAPDLQVFGGVAIVILGRTLPRDDKGTLRREAELVDAGHGESENGGAVGGVNDADGLG